MACEIKLVNEGFQADFHSAGRVMSPVVRQSASTPLGSSCCAGYCEN